MFFFLNLYIDEVKGGKQVVARIHSCINMSNDTMIIGETLLLSFCTARTQLRARSEVMCEPRYSSNVAVRDPSFTIYHIV